MLFVKVTVTATKTSPLRWVIYSKSLVKMPVTRRCIYRYIYMYPRFLAALVDREHFRKCWQRIRKERRACSWKLQTSSPRHFSGKSFNVRSLVRSVTERVFLIPGENSFHLTRKSLSNERTSASRETLASRERTLSFVIIFLFSNTIEKRRGGGKN